VRNTSIETVRFQNNPSTINNDAPAILVTPYGLNSISIPARGAASYIAAADSSGKKRWYPTLLMTGSI
jgi:hypothetical protein